MRLKAVLRKNTVLYKVTGTLTQLSKLCWLRLDDHSIRLTVIPEGGSQCWSSLNLDTIFDAYDISSNSDSNVINLEINAYNLHRALRSTIDTPACELSLIKRSGVPYLCLTIRKISAWKRARLQSHIPDAAATQTSNAAAAGTAAANTSLDDDADTSHHDGTTARPGDEPHMRAGTLSRGRFLDDGATEIVHDIPVRVLKPERLQAIQEPQVPDPDVFIHLPAISQLKSISDRYTRLAGTGTDGAASTLDASDAAPRRKAVLVPGIQGPRTAKIDLAATMHGGLRLSYAHETLRLQSTWEGLRNVRPDPKDLEGGEEALRNHPSTRMMEMGNDEEGERGWARVRIDGRDWGKVLAVGRLGGDVIAAFCNETCLVLYVYLRDPDDEGELDSSILTYYVNSFSMY